ncbi:P-loop containing nucleoside triphosphate hydrolase protein [Suillus subluteus]|nr:P-loop containing nucleoside triphosphate hydrolase protein [Suillus subluteus]
MSRVLIFFQMMKVMDIMEDFLKLMGWKYFHFDGENRGSKHALHVQQFNVKDLEIKVFILSTQAGGLGLNLQTADTVVMFAASIVTGSRLCSPYWPDQGDFHILRFIMEKSVEEAMYARAWYKLNINDKVIQAGCFDNKLTQEESLLMSVRRRSILEADQEEENEEAGDMNDDELNEIIEGRGQRRRNVVNYNDGLNNEQWAVWSRGPKGRSYAPKDLSALSTAYGNVTPSVIDNDNEERDVKRQKTKAGDLSPAIKDKMPHQLLVDPQAPQHMTLLLCLWRRMSGPQRGRVQSAGRKQVISNGEYLTPSDDD